MTTRTSQPAGGALLILITGKSVVKVIVVPDKLVNIVVR